MSRNILQILLKGGTHMSGISIRELAERTREAQEALGLSAHTVWNHYITALLPVVKLHEQAGMEHFNRSIVDEYISQIEGRRERAEIGPNHYGRLRHGAERLIEMHETGKIEWSCRGRASKFVLNEYYEALLDDFLTQKDWHPNTRGDLTWITRKFFAWLLQEGYADLCGVGAQEIQRFMIHCSNHLRSTSLYNMQLYLKKLCRYLHERGHLPNTFQELLSFKVSRESKMYPAAMDDEVAAVLDTIDRLTTKGKRDYAIILLAVTTGLRAIDITRLKLSDIDWRAGEIKIVQSKTGQPLALPLTKDIGEAIQDYILNGRQKSESDAIFLRHHAPFQAFADSVSIGDMYDAYCKRAGVSREPHDGKGFHSLRRSVGKKLVTAGVSINTTAQILGDAKLNSTEKYISLDSRHLKECALDFSGIEMEAAI
jgi:integrase